MQLPDLISQERLDTYRRFAHDEKKAIALHNQTLQLGSSIMSMIAVLELSLRNGTNLQLVDHFNEPDWLLPNKESVPIKPEDQRLISKAQSNARRAI